MKIKKLVSAAAGKSIQESRRILTDEVLQNVTGRGIICGFSQPGTGDDSGGEVHMGYPD